MDRRLNDIPHISAYVALVLSAAIFGFFYAWVCSTIWGLDDADPTVAIEAMQAMNDSVRNAVFFPAFFLTPVGLAVAGLIAARRRHRTAATLFIAAALTYAIGAMLITLAVNVPMNEDLADQAVPASSDAAQRVWDDYSGPWQAWNVVRTIFSGVAVVLAAIGLAALGRRDGAAGARPPAG